MDSQSRKLFFFSNAAFFPGDFASNIARANGPLEHNWKI